MYRSLLGRAFCMFFRILSLLALLLGFLYKSPAMYVFVLISCDDAECINQITNLHFWRNYLLFLFISKKAFDGNYVYKYVHNEYVSILYKINSCKYHKHIRKQLHINNFCICTYVHINPFARLVEPPFPRIYIFHHPAYISSYSHFTIDGKSS